MPEPPSVPKNVDDPLADLRIAVDTHGAVTQAAQQAGAEVQSEKREQVEREQPA